MLQFTSLLSSVTESVSVISSKLKDAIENTAQEFEKANLEFVQEKREANEPFDWENVAATHPPWIGAPDEEDLKSAILSLSKDKRNFLVDPPTGTDFKFDISASYPSALSILEQDDNLKKMRFDLVPKQVKEAIFWRNYFYRVSIARQARGMGPIGTNSKILHASTVAPISIPERVSVASQSEKMMKSADVNIPASSVVDGSKEATRASTPIPMEAAATAETAPLIEEVDKMTSAYDGQETERWLQNLKDELGEDLAVDAKGAGSADVDGDDKQDISEWEKELQAEIGEEFAS